MALTWYRKVPHLRKNHLFMLRLSSFLLLAFCCLLTTARAQDYSNRGLLEIKERSEALRLSWIKAFDEAVQSKNFSSLQALRKENEGYLDQHMSMIRRLYAEGDGRALLSAVNNYMQIERQFVRDVMVPVEAFTASSQEGVNRTYQKIDDFGQKEKVFLIDINNAIRSESMDEGAQGSAAPQQVQQQEEDTIEEPQGSIIEGRPARKKGKLPHEQEEEEDEDVKKKDSRKKKKRSASEEEE
jgi:hypothetical protein